MIIFDGTYRWKAPIHGDTRTFRKKWEMSCDLKVIDLSLSRPDVIHLKRYVVVAFETTAGPMKMRVADSMGKRIFRDFHLNRGNVLWIEGRPNHNESLEVATFIPESDPGEETRYRISWRAIRSNEEKLIRAYLPESLFLSEKSSTPHQPATF